MREITEEVGGGEQIRFQANALEALQQAAEAYLVNEFERTKFHHCQVFTIVLM